MSVEERIEAGMVDHHPGKAHGDLIGNCAMLEGPSGNRRVGTHRRSLSFAILYTLPSK